MSDNGVFLINSEYGWDLEDLIFTTKEKAKEYIEYMIKDDHPYYVYIVFGDDAKEDSTVDCDLLQKEEIIDIRWVELNPKFFT